MSSLNKKTTPFRISKRRLLARTLDYTGCGRMLRAASTWEGVLILNYHRIGNRHASLLDRNLWSATDDDFDEQISMIARNYQVIGMDELDSALHRRRGNFVMVTFDDGYLDNYTNAFPILKAHGVPATFFITTGFLDVPSVPWWDEIAWMVRSSPLEALDVNPWTTTPVPFDEPDREAAIGRLLAVYKRLSGSVTSDYMDFLGDALKSGRCPNQVARELWMSWDNIREMRNNGMTFGGHTVTHPILTNVSADQQDDEIGTCRRRLVEELGEPIDGFSYPVGGRKSFDSVSREALHRHGYKWGFTYIGGYCHHGHQDNYSIYRTAIETDIDQSHFRALLTIPQVFA